jgi:hypothetical protein
MKVEDIKENEDGSAIITIETTDEERKMLIELGFIKLIMDHIAKTA